jgi:hypothetical protein
MSERAARRRAEREARKNRLPATAVWGACSGCGKCKTLDLEFRLCLRCQHRYVESVMALSKANADLGLRVLSEEEFAQLPESEQKMVNALTFGVSVTGDGQ